MSYYLYQMTANDQEPLRPENFRKGVCEVQVVKWDDETHKKGLGEGEAS
jgi:hypothetical protein